VHARRLFDGAAVLHDRVVELDAQGTVLEVRGPRRGDPAPHEGLVVPGLVNAHTHLELSWLRAPHGVPAGGFVPWGQSLFARLAEAPSQAERLDAARTGVRTLRGHGTALISDVGGALPMAPLLLDEGLSAVAGVELLGFDASGVEGLVARAETLGGISHGPSCRVVERPCAHAPYSTAPQVIRAALGRRVGGAPASIHLAEDRDELELLATGGGRWATFLDDLGRDWRWWRAPGGSPVSYLAGLGVLGPQTLLVHGVHLDAADRALLAATGTPLVLCPRSNLHIGGELPDVPSLIEAGVPLALGTDSLGSCPDTDVLGEIPALCDAFPDIPTCTWLGLACEAGAHALCFSELGRVVPGARPGLLALGAELDDLRTGPPASRRWLVSPGRRAASRPPTGRAT
jgi:cytosine/adenosine deaminase-related metal-dependent hydrolase